MPNFFALTQANSASIRRACYALAKNREDAEDLVGDAILRAHRGFPGFRGASFSTWMNRVVYHVFLDTRKKRRVQTVPIEAIFPDGSYDPGSPDSVFDEVADKFEREDMERRVQDLDRRVQGLPEHMRDVVLLTIDGLTYEQIAEQLGIAVGTVKSRLNRARALLKGTTGAYRRL